MKDVRYICKNTNKNNKVWYSQDTLAYYKNRSIELLLGEGSYTWEQCKRFGWRCVKVQVTITEI